MIDPLTFDAFAHERAVLALKRGDIVTLGEPAELAYTPHPSGRGWLTRPIFAGTKMRVRHASDDGFSSKWLSVEIAGPTGVQGYQIWQHQFGLVEIGVKEV